MAKEDQNNVFGDMLNDFKSIIRDGDQQNVDEKCLDLCRTYVAGDWLNVGLENVEIKRLTGGLTNRIYVCKAITGSTDEVVIRFYGDKYDDIKTFDKQSPRFDDGLIAYIASEAKLGPEIYGLFVNGQVMKYYKVLIF